MADSARSAVVTGSGKGIGRAVAERLTADGWIVIGLERSPGSGTVDDGIVAEVVLGDASDRAVHERAATAARARAPLAGWVNNAGITKRTPLHELDETTVREILDINGFGYLWGCSAAVSAFIDQGVAGAIVNIGSIHGRSSFVDHAAYEFTKGGIDALTRSVAVSYGGLGIRANTVAPGGVRTPHLDAQIAAAADPAAEERALTEGPPMGRIARAEEVAALTAFLLSDAAPYVSGQSIAVDGAWTASFGRIATDPALRARFERG
ncbi:Diacetyl reductase [(S)-acetoin forming] [Microbacterium oxydans]|uniref:SDR family NAD(P)-dependent oxidoreductase n=1 Tax=Microbacterium oxydans TaxID=82380 RepID=UPI001D774978|nr:SDR family oxidoreductase [Microbacterium oxydans]CAH0208538.1 Diacetyl reductase [(S)-acetoin forming] [Microbacterium oxydans]